MQYLGNIKWLFESWISSSSDQFQINIAVDYIQKLCGVFDKWKKRIWDNDFFGHRRILQESRKCLNT